MAGIKFTRILLALGRTTHCSAPSCRGDMTLVSNPVDALQYSSDIISSSFVAMLPVIEPLWCGQLENRRSSMLAITGLALHYTMDP